MQLDGFFDTVSPKVGSKIVSAVIALLITFGGFKGYDVISAVKLSDGKTEGGSETTEDLETAAPSEKPTVEKIFFEDGAKELSGEVSAEGVAFCDITNMNIIAQKEKEKVISCGEITVFATALLVSRAIDSGRVSETDYAVCPASAQRKNGYQLSSAILPVGKKMMIKDILRCMIYQRGSSFAYTLAVHISGSEESFVSELNALAAELKMSGTAFSGVCGEVDTVSKTTALDTAILLKAFISDTRLKGIFCSNEPLAIKNSETVSSVYLTVANDFFVSNCTEGQANADGISGGKIGNIGSGKWSAVLFSKDGTEYVVVVLNSPSPYSETLKLYAAYI